MRIMGIDPGGTTGVAVVDAERDGDVSYSLVDVVQYPYGKTLEGELKVAQKLGRMFWELKCDVVVMEEFSLRLPAKSAGRDGIAPARLEGLLYASLRSSGVEKLDIVTQPSSVLAVMTSDRLRRLGLWIPKWEHARCAAWHVVSYVRSSGCV